MSMTPQQRFEHLMRLPVRQIAVWRPLKIGDLLVVVPALRALRAAFPDAVIDYIGLPETKELAWRFRMYLDGFVPFLGLPGLPEREWQAADLVRFLRGMQRRKYDLLLQMHGSGRVVNYFVPLSGARITAGYASKDAYRPNDDWFAPYPEDKHEIHKFLDLLTFLGVPAADDSLEFPVSKRDERDLQQLVQFDKPHACIHPGSASSRRWSADYFAAVADACSAMGLRPVLTGSKDEVELARSVAERTKSGAVVLAGKTSLGTLAALLKNAEFYIGNDTGPAHLARALDVPSITIFFNADPARWGPLNTSRHRVVLADEATPETVIKQIKELFKL